MRRLASDTGFSLVSVLIAVVLVSLALVALSGSMVSISAFRTEANVRSTATDLAAAYMEDVKARDPASLASESAVNVDAQGQVSASGRYVRSLTVTAGTEPRSKRVTVTVAYPRGEATTGVIELVTIIYEGAS